MGDEEWNAQNVTLIKYHHNFNNISFLSKGTLAQPNSFLGKDANKKVENCSISKSILNNRK